MEQQLVKSQPVNRGMSTIADEVKLPSFNMRITFNTEASPEQAMKTVGTVCEALARQDMSMQHLRLLLGRVLVQIQERQLFKPDYTSFNKFLQEAEKKTKTSRSILWECMSIAAIPKIEPEEVEKMPYTNLRELARASKVVEEPSLLTEIRRDAKKLSVVAYRKKLETAGLLAKRGRPDGRRRRGPVTLRITVPAAVARLWYELEQPVEAFAEWVKGHGEKAARSAA